MATIGQNSSFDFAIILCMLLTYMYRCSDKVQITGIYFQLDANNNFPVSTVKCHACTSLKYASLINFTKYTLVKRNKFFWVLTNEHVFYSQYIPFKGLAIHNSL